MVRIPLAGPYRPRARLFRFPNDRVVWHVRLWEFDRAVPHVVSTAVLYEFARRNRLPTLAADIDALLARTARRGRP